MDQAQPSQGMSLYSTMTAFSNPAMSVLPQERPSYRGN